MITLLYLVLGYMVGWYMGTELASRKAQGLIRRVVNLLDRNVSSQDRGEVYVPREGDLLLLDELDEYFK